MEVFERVFSFIQGKVVILTLSVFTDVSLRWMGGLTVAANSGWQVKAQRCDWPG
jgi:hypothetical protein